MDDVPFLAMIVAALIAVVVLVSIDNDKCENIVLPTCAELDSYGYDGLASCIDESGHILTPGDN